MFPIFACLISVLLSMRIADILIYQRLLSFLLYLQVRMHFHTTFFPAAKLIQTVLFLPYATCSCCHINLLQCFLCKCSHLWGNTLRQMSKIRGAKNKVSRKKNKLTRQLSWKTQESGESSNKGCSSEQDERKIMDTSVCVKR